MFYDKVGVQSKKAEAFLSRVRRSPEQKNASSNLLYKIKNMVYRALKDTLLFSTLFAVSSGIMPLSGCRYLHRRDNERSEVSRARAKSLAKKPHRAIETDFGMEEKSRESPSPDPQNPSSQNAKLAPETLPGKESAAAEPVAQTLYVTAVQLHIRSRPDRFSPSVGYKFGGDKVMVKVKGDWSELGDGKWLRTRWLSSDFPEQFRDTKK